MYTHLDVIFDKFLSQIDDIELSLISDRDVEELLVDCLENATVEFKECKKDLTIVKSLIEDFKYKNTRKFSIFYQLDDNTTVSVRDQKKEYVEGVDYTLTYNDSSYEITIELKQSATGEITTSIRKEGYIKDELTLEEIYILALSMKLFWLSPKINREENLRQIMQDRDFKQLSNANMLKALLSLQKSTRQELQKFKQRYAFNEFKGFD